MCRVGGWYWWQHRELALHLPVPPHLSLSGCFFFSFSYPPLSFLPISCSSFFLSLSLPSTPPYTLNSSLNATFSMDHLILSPILLPYRRNRQNWTGKMKISWISCCWCQENKSYSTFPSSGVFQPGLRHSATRKLRLTPLSLSPPVSCVCLLSLPPVGISLSLAVPRPIGGSCLKLSSL